MNTRIIWEENGIYVTKDFIVFYPSESGTHVETDSAYTSLDLALCRALYLSRGPGRHAKEAMRLASTLD